MVIVKPPARHDTPPAGLDVAKLLRGCRDRLFACQSRAAARGLPQSLSGVVRRGLTVFLMLVFSGLLGYLPGVGIALFSGMTLALLLTFGIAVAAVVLMCAAYQQVACVLGHFAREVFHLPAGDAALDASVTKLAWHVALLVYACLVYWISTWAINPIILVLTPRRWPYMVMDITSLAVAVAAIVGILIATSPLFGRVGDSVARRVVAGPTEPAADAPQSKCPGCGVLYPDGSRYCAFCGKALT